MRQEMDALEQAIDPRFWPTSLIEWLTVFGVIAGAAAAIWRFVRQPIMDRVNGLGERVNAQAIKVSALEARMDTTDKAVAFSQLDRSNLHESVSRMSVEMQALMKLTQRAEVQRAEDLGDIRERLARIETKVSTRREGDRHHRNE